MSRILRTCGLMLGVALATTAIPSLTEAKDLNVTIIAGGEAYDGLPRFRLLADGKTIGEADVDHALQPKNGKSPLDGRGPNLDTVGSSLRKFSFTVPDGDKVSQYSIQFLNDAWGGAGSTLDRNLWVREVIVGGTRYPADKLTGDGKTSQIANGLAVLLMNGSVTLQRPDAGWPEAVAASKASPASCSSLAPLLVTGYGIGQVEVPADQTEKIKEFASASASAGCSVIVTGLTTPGGSQQGNMRIGTARADIVKKHLASAGVKKIKTNLNAGSKERGVLLTTRR